MRMSQGADQTSPASAAGSRKPVSKQRWRWGKCFFGHKVFMVTFRYALLFFISFHFIWGGYFSSLNTTHRRRDEERK